MQRITISIDDGLADTFDRMIKARAYASRSEALRDLVRENVERWRQDDSDAQHSVANLSYVYDRRTRALAERLAAMEHHHHNLVASSTTYRLDHEHSLVSVVLKGATLPVRTFADQIAAQRGVRFAKLNLIAVDPSDLHDEQAHAHRHHHGDHHLSPRSN